MNDARIAELLEPFLSDNSRRHTPALSPSQVRLISMYVDLLLRWNDRVNLTAIREPEEIVTRHFGESIFAARQLFPQPEVEAGSDGACDRHRFRSRLPRPSSQNMGAAHSPHPD